ncbi:MAG: hypothetical protein K6F34_08610 [Lachnospiraceae bacterium]|nr:hypothetical protein [Lachnospiraceae bacterium]
MKKNRTTPEIYVKIEKAGEMTGAFGGGKMDSYMYYCADCNRLFKVGGTGKKAKCPQCEGMLKDLGVSSEEYAAMDTEKKNALKAGMTEPEPGIQNSKAQQPEFKDRQPGVQDTQQAGYEPEQESLMSQPHPEAQFADEQSEPEIRLRIERPQGYRTRRPDQRRRAQGTGRGAGMQDECSTMRTMVIAGVVFGACAVVTAVCLFIAS